MSRPREIKTCDRCRGLKRRCDLLRPVCTRCRDSKVTCSFTTDGLVMASNNPPTMSSPDGTTLAPAPVNPLAVSASVPPPGMNAAAAGNMTPASVSLSPGQVADVPMLSDPRDSLISPSVSSVSPEPASQASRQNGMARAEEVRTAAAAVGQLSTTSPDSSSHDAHSLLPQIRATTISGNQPASKAARQPRKRKRTCLSCHRCHRLKVKCDKELPCSRCESSGNGGQCYYNYNKGHHSGRFPSTAPPPSLPHDDPKAMMAIWQVHHRTRGASHWRDLMVKIADLAGPERSPRLNGILLNIATNACLSNFSLPGNFPFGTPGASKYYARDAVARLVEDEADNFQFYIETYLEILDVVNPILDVPKFWQEVDDYWNSPAEMSLCWLAQFLMVLGLGAFVSSVPEPAVATEFMLAAEACLMQTPFMFRPTMATLKALTLMVVAKQICNATCWSVDSAWSLLGHLVRACYTFGLPQEKDEKERQITDPQEREVRRKLWLSILYLDAKVTMSAGMPPQMRADEILGGIRETGDIKTELEPETVHMVLYQCMPTVLFVMARMNTKDDQVAYDDVIKHSSVLRTLISQARQVCVSDLQFLTLDIFLRRCLMVLHRPFALHPDGPRLFPDSYWTSLECSLAIMMHYREIFAPGSIPGYSVMGRAYVLDIFSATLTVCLHVMRGEVPMADASAEGGFKSWGSQIPQRQLILDTVKSCIEIWEGEKDRSVCYRTAFQLLVAIQDLMPRE